MQRLGFIRTVTLLSAFVIFPAAPALAIAVDPVTVTYQASIRYADGLLAHLFTPGESIRVQYSLDPSAQNLNNFFPNDERVHLLVVGTGSHLRRFRSPRAAAGRDSE